VLRQIAIVLEERLSTAAGTVGVRICPVALLIGVLEGEPSGSA